FWRSFGEDWGVAPDGIVQLVVGARPRETGDIVAQLTGPESGFGGDAALVSPGVGTIRLRFPTTAVAPTDLWSRLSVLRTRTAATAMVEFAPPAWRRQVDVWGPPPGSIAMMKALKREFDPGGILNRGRMMI
ncbi:MAG: hypothetical protein ACTHMX_06920, partial [Thermomicrobiales bacterium]